MNNYIENVLVYGYPDDEHNDKPVWLIKEIERQEIGSEEWSHSLELYYWSREYGEPERLICGFEDMPLAARNTLSGFFKKLCEKKKFNEFDLITSAIEDRYTNEDSNDSF